MKSSVKIGEHTIRLWVIAALLISVICIGVSAYYVWKTIIIPVEVKEPLEILSYPSKLTLFPGEIKEVNVTIMNYASRNYTIILDFVLDNLAYQDNYVTFSNENYTVIPGQQNLTGWLKVQSNAPPINTSLIIDFWRITELSGITRIKSIIKVEAEGTVLHLRNESFWVEDQFLSILEHKAEFKICLIEQLNESLSTYGERGEYAMDVNIEFDEVRKTTVLECNVLGAVSKSGSKYHATFRWLLGTLKLDFIDDDFEHIEKGLHWKGLISGVPTTVILKFPVSVPAWGQPNGHCHAHVWWEI